MPPQSQNGVSPMRTRRSNGRDLLSPQSETMSSPTRKYNSGPKKNGQLRTQRELRMAYRAQTDNNQIANGINISFDNNDQHSMSAGSIANSAGTPSSVYMPSVALSRELSDLSGVSGGTHRGSSKHTIPGQIFDSSSLSKPWKQAYTLSNTPPESNRDDVASEELLVGNKGGRKNNNKSQKKTKAKSASIWVADDDAVEIFDDLESSLGLDRFQIMEAQHNRIPIMILLMNPSNQSYELMQIWVDRANDSIRDLVQVLQHKLPVRWKQAYDGLFQVRGHRFTQLINIIRLVKYDIQPHEMLIAKPWAMTAKVTIAFAGSAIKHLTKIGVMASSQSDSSSTFHRRSQRPQSKNEDSPLLLSKQAQDRVYFPEGIMSHHHAMQFMTFSPPFESSSKTDGKLQEVNPIGALPETESLSNNDSNSNFDSDHFGEPSSSLLVSKKENRNSNHSSRSIRRSFTNSFERRQKSAESLLRLNKNGSKDNQEDSERILKNRTIAARDLTDINTTTNSHLNHTDDDEGRYCGRRLQRLNCFRKKTNDNYSNYRTKKDSTNNSSGRKQHQQQLLQPCRTALSEDEEKQWMAYSMKPIAEDQSLASGSVVSMSAPLLSQTLLLQNKKAAITNAKKGTKIQKMQPIESSGPGSFSSTNHARFYSRKMEEAT